MGRSKRRLSTHYGRVRLTCEGGPKHAETRAYLPPISADAHNAITWRNSWLPPCAADVTGRGGAGGYGQLLARQHTGRHGAGANWDTPARHGAWRRHRLLLDSHRPLLLFFFVIPRGLRKRGKGEGRRQGDRKIISTRTIFVDYFIRNRVDSLFTTNRRDVSFPSSHALHLAVISFRD